MPPDTRHTEWHTQWVYFNPFASDIMTSPELQVLFDSPALRIACRPSEVETDRTVVAFAGVQGAFGGIPVAEFAGALGRSPMPHDAVFVVDKTRGWYNTTAPDIEAVIAPRLAGRRVVTLGNSMGGFGALLFGERLGAESALAICPQYAIGADLVPFETRWRDFAAAIPVFRHPACLPDRSAGGTTRLVLVGADDETDMAHARLIRDRLDAEDGLFVLKGCGHDVAPALKRSGALAAVLDAVLAPGGGRDAVAAALGAAALDYRLWANGASDASKSG